MSVKRYRTWRIRLLWRLRLLRLMSPSWRSMQAGVLPPHPPGHALYTRGTPGDEVLLKLPIDARTRADLFALGYRRVWRQTLDGETRPYPPPAKTPVPFPAHWWEKRCRAVQQMPEGGYRRCDLKHQHVSHHRADYGMYVVRWSRNSEVAP